jgi:hypothetical protein
MDCLMHQVLVAMLAATPVPDAPAPGKVPEIKANSVAAAPVKAGRVQVAPAKRGKDGTQVVLVTIPRPAAVN